MDYKTSESRQSNQPTGGFYATRENVQSACDHSGDAASANPFAANGFSHLTAASLRFASLPDQPPDTSFPTTEARTVPRRPRTSTRARTMPSLAPFASLICLSLLPASLPCDVFEERRIPQSWLPHLQVMRSLPAADSASCATTCYVAPECKAVRFDPPASLCHLLTGYVSAEGPTGPGPMVRLLAPRTRNFGRCPSDFEMRVGASSYKLMPAQAGKTWAQLQGVCRAMGGAKLAEITSVGERDALEKLLDPFCTWREGAFVGGLQDPGSSEPKGGWFWNTSRIPIQIDNFVWESGEPNEYGREDVVALRYCSRLTLIDVHHGNTSKFQRGFLCECVDWFFGDK